MGLSRVLILHNQPILPHDHPHAESEHEICETVVPVEIALSEAGFIVGKLGVGRDLGEMVEGIRQFHPDAVFNLFEGLGDDGDTEACAAGMLDWLKIPFTGCQAATIALARNKPLTKHLLRSAGLPTADFVVCDNGTFPDLPLKWPLIVKPAMQDASVGMDQDSVAVNFEQLQKRVSYLLENFGPPVLVEEFIDGREFSVFVLETPELIALPASEIVFLDKGQGRWPIVTYDAKWREHSSEYEATPWSALAEISPRLAQNLTELAISAFRLARCRDYARLDFRVRTPELPYILEVNPNPDLLPQSGLAAALRGVGRSYDQLIVQFVHNALAHVSPRSVSDPVDADLAR